MGYRDDMRDDGRVPKEFSWFTSQATALLHAYPHRCFQRIGLLDFDLPFIMRLMQARAYIIAAVLIFVLGSFLLFIGGQPNAGFSF